MRETRQKIEFFNEFIDTVESKGRSQGSRQIPFMTELLTYMDQEDDPAIFYYKNDRRNIQLNGYIFQEETNTLNLYVVEYDNELAEDVIPEINKTAIVEIANSAKRFFTNVDYILEITDRSFEYHDLAKLISNKKNEIEEINIYILTSRFYLTNKPIEMTIPGIDSVNVHVWDMDRIYKLSEAEQGIRDFDIHFNEEYNQPIEMMYIPKKNQEKSEYSLDCYVGFIPALLLARLYDDWGPKLVERNVRSFLQARGGTNKGIRDTLKDPSQRELFVAYNNGISSVAKDGDIVQVGDTNLYRINSITSWQIVNGGQTTASIHQAYKNGIDLEGVNVQTKLIIIKVNTENEKDRYILEDEMVSKISEYANTQNKINKSDLLANTRFMSDIEKYSRSIWIPSLDNRKEESKWYFERARGQYMVDIGRRKKAKEQVAFKKVYPKEKVISKVEMAKYFISWECYPHISSKGGEEAFKRFMQMNSEYWKYSVNDDGEISNVENIDSDFYKLLIARRVINAYTTNIVDQMSLKGYRANVIYYTTSMLSFLYGRQIDLMEVWNRQQLSNQWENVVKIIAKNALNYLKESAGDRNVTQWAKSEECWEGFKKESATVLSHLV